VSFPVNPSAHRLAWKVGRSIVRYAFTEGLLDHHPHHLSVLISRTFSSPASDRTIGTRFNGISMDRITLPLPYRTPERFIAFVPNLVFGDSFATGLDGHSLFGRVHSERWGIIETAAFIFTYSTQVPAHDGHSTSKSLCKTRVCSHWAKKNECQPISRLIGAASFSPLLRRLSIGTHTAVLSLGKKPDMKMKTEGQICDCSWTAIWG
jgi:hypothetical protein